MLKMLKIFLTIVFAHLTGSCDVQNDPASKQIIDFKMITKCPVGIMTTSTGAPVDIKDATIGLNTNVFINENFVDDMTHFVRERIPERVVHAAGTGAFGYFEVTHNISHICKAKLFSKVGKKTAVAVRFSLGFSSIGVSDTTREIRGFSIKFYTEEGILDLLGVNTPIAALKNPLLFGRAIHAARRNPSTNLPDPNAIWDFLTLRPEVIFLFLYIFSEYGTPKSYSHMPGFPVHTYEVYNKEGQKSYIRFHFYPEAGVKNLNETEAIQIAAGDPDYYARDLYNSISKGKYPSYKIKVQILSKSDVDNADFDVFDVTKILPLDKYPLHDLGRLILNKNPRNHFAEIEQLGFSPGNIVPGILGGPDKAFEVRRFVYRDAQNYRLGANFKKILVNRPTVPVFTYHRDGVSPVNDNENDSPNYYPNTVNGPIPYEEKNRPTLSHIIERKEDNFGQASDFYVNVLNSSEKSTLVNNLVASISLCEQTIRSRAIKTLKMINSDLGQRVAKGIEAKCSEK